MTTEVCINKIIEHCVPSKVAGSFAGGFGVCKVSDGAGAGDGAGVGDGLSVSHDGVSSSF